MEKIFDLGKIAYQNDKKINPVEITVVLFTKKKDGRNGLSITSTIWNQVKTDWLAISNNLDILIPYLQGNEIFEKILKFSKYNNNLTSLEYTPLPEDVLEEIKTLITAN